MLSNLHRYLGLILCLILLTIGLTGTLLVWKKEFLWLSFADARVAIDRKQQMAAIEAIEAQYPANTIQLIQLYSEGLPIHKVFLSERRYAWHNQAGLALQTWSANERFEDWLLDLHHRFLLGNTVGLNIAGFGGLLALLLVALGIGSWWRWRKSFSLRLWPGSLARRDLIRSHGHLGALFAPAFILIILTGVILVYPVESRLVLVDGFGESSEAVTQAEMAVVSPFSWPLAHNKVANKYPGAIVRWVAPASEKYPNNVIGFQQAQGLNRLGMSSITFTADHQVRVKDALQQRKVRRAFDFSYPLHTAKLGVWYRVLISLVGLALVTSCVLGVYSFTKRS